MHPARQRHEETRRQSLSNRVADAVKDCAVVYHLAALASVTKSVEDPLRSHAICATGTLQVLDAARRAKVRRVVYAAR